MNVPSMLGGQVQAVHKNRAQHGIAFMPVLRRTNPLSRKQSERFCGILPGLWVECCWCGPVFAEFRASAPPCCVVFSCRPRCFTGGFSKAIRLLCSMIPRDPHAALRYAVQVTSSQPNSAHVLLDRRTLL